MPNVVQTTQSPSEVLSTRFASSFPVHSQMMPMDDNANDLPAMSLLMYVEGDAGFTEWDGSEPITGILVADYVKATDDHKANVYLAGGFNWDKIQTAQTLDDARFASIGSPLFIINVEEDVVGGVPNPVVP